MVGSMQRSPVRGLSYLTLCGLLVSTFSLAFEVVAALFARGLFILFLGVFVVLVCIRRHEWQVYLSDLRERKRLLPFVLMVIFGASFLATFVWTYWPEATPQGGGQQAEKGGASKDDQLPTSNTDKLTPEQIAGLPGAVEPTPKPNQPPRSIVGGSGYPAPSPAPSPHLTRSFTLTGFEPNLATPPSGERQLDSYSISFANMGGDMIRSTVKSFSLSADGSIVLTAGERTLNFLAPGQTQSAGISPTSGQRIPLATGTKEMIAEIRIDYDTVPPSGVRHVYRKVRHIVHWPEEGRSLWLETSILDEGEN